MRRNYSEGNQKMLCAGHTDTIDSTCSCPASSSAGDHRGGGGGGESYSVSSYKTCSDSFTAVSTPHSSPGSQDSQDAKPKRLVSLTIRSVYVRLKYINNDASHCRL